MTTDEARLFLGVIDDIDPEDAYLERMHELKTQFSDQVPFKKLYQSRWNRLKKIEEAFLVLGGMLPVLAENNVHPFIYSIEQSLLDLFGQFNRLNNSLRTQLYNSHSPKEVETLTGKIYENYYSFAKSLNSDVYLPDLKISQKTDEVELYNELRELESKGVTHLGQLDLDDSKLQVVREVNRLSLWFKKESNE